MEKHKLPENLEGFTKIDLKIVEPIGDKGWNIQFESNSVNLCNAYSIAIESVAKDLNLKPFHQGGMPNERGWHMWEFWSETDRDEIESIIDTIHQKAEETFNRHRELGI